MANSTFRDMTPDEVDARQRCHHERRAADSFVCPHCDFETGASAYVSDTAVCHCSACGRDFFAWTVPGTIHVSAKLNPQ